MSKALELSQFANDLLVDSATTTITNLLATGDGEFSGDLTVDGNLIVNGTTVTVSTANLAVADNMIYLNNGIQATITSASGDGATVTYTADNNYTSGMVVTVTGVTPSSFNVTNQTITAATSSSFSIASSNTDTYVSGGTARAKTSINPDLGFAGGYNDGSYAHAGFFRDATDGRWKVFKGYTPEPDLAQYIDTSHASFALADFQAAAILGTTGTFTGAVTLSSDFTVDTTTLKVDAANNRVGIGTNTPAARLDVRDTRDTSSDHWTNGQASIFVYNTHASGDAILKLVGTSNNGRIVYGTGNGSDKLIFSSRSSTSTTTEHITFDDNGNIGVGTTAPTNRLHIVAPMSATPTTILIEPTGSNVVGGGGAIAFDTSATNVSPSTFLAKIEGVRTATDDGSNELRFFTSTASVSGGAPQQRMVITETGSVGIGTDAPVRKLHVLGSGGTIAAKVEATDGNQASLDLKNSEGEFRLITDGGELKIYDQTDTAYRFVMDTSGNIGIGTETPDSMMHLYSTTGDTILTIEADADDNTEWDNPQIHFLTDGGLKTAAITGGNATNEGTPNNFNALNLQSQTIRFHTGASQNFDLTSEVMRITSAGNVGIGTTSPARNLVVSGTGGVLVSIVSTDNDNCQLMFGDSASDTIGKVIYRHADDRLTLQAGNTETVHVVGGNVGIGVTNPVDKLHIVQSDQFGIRLERASHDTMGIALIGAQRLSFLNYTDGNREDLVIEKTAGKVGIGTTNPQSRLELYDNPPTLMLTSSSANAPTIEFKRINTSTTWGADNYTDWKITDESGYLKFRSGYNGITDTALTLYGDTTTTKVGINTDTPNTSEESLGIWSGGATGGSSTKVLALYNNHTTTYPADGLTSYNATTSYTISDKTAYAYHARAMAAGNITTHVSIVNSEPVNSDRYVRLAATASLNTPLHQRYYYSWDGAGSTAADMNVPSGQLLEQVIGYGNVAAFRLYNNGDTYFSGALQLGIADTASGHINAYENMTFNIDTDNDDANTRIFGWYKNGESGSGTELMRLTETALLGIGTSPTAPIHAYQAAALNSDVVDVLKLETYRSDFTTIGGSAILFKNQDGNNTTNEARIKVLTSNTASELADSNEASSNFVFSTTRAGTEYDHMIISSNGNVGIGTFIPGATYGPTAHIYGSNPNIHLQGSNTSSWAYFELENTNYNRAFGMSTGGDFRITADKTNMDASVQFVVLQNGNVGIGTLSPAGLQSWAKGTRILDLKLETTPATGDVGVQFRANTGAYLGLAAGGGTGIGVVIDSNNKVGIGTAAPETPLHVYQAGATPTLLTLHNYQSDISGLGNQGNFIDFKMTDDNATATPQVRIGMRVYDNDGADAGIASEGAGNFVIETMDPGAAIDGTGTLTEHLRVTDKGMVGIGKTNPSVKLHVDGGSGYAAEFITTSDVTMQLSSSNSWTGIRFNDSGGTNDDLWHNGTYGTFAMGGGGSNVSGKKLHVHGGMTIGSGLAATGTATNGLTVEGDIVANSDIGINISSPAQRLHVYESADSPQGANKPTTVALLAARTDSTNEGPSIDFASVWTASSTYQPTNDDTGWVVARIAGVYDATASNGGALTFYTNAGPSAILGSDYANLAERMRINPTGDVGIGTNNPGNRLHVYEAAMVGPDPVVKVNAFYQTDTTYNGHGSIMQLTTNRGDGFSDGYLLDVQNSDGIAMKIRGDRVTVLSPGTTDYLGNQTGVVHKTLQIHDEYDAVGTHWTAYANLDGNWLDGATGTDTQHGWIFGHGNDVRGGLIYDHRSTERMAMWSSYGRMDFLIANTTDGNGVPIDSNIVEAMTIAIGGNIGIGTTSPTAKLDVEGTINGASNIKAYNGTTEIKSDGIYFETGNHCITWNDGAGNFNIRVGHGPAETALEAGYVSHIEWSQSSGWLQVNATSASKAVNDAITWNNTWQYTFSNGQFSSPGDVVAYSSDRRLKTNITNIDNALDKVLKLNGVYFDWADDINERGFFGAEPGEHAVGVIAQEVESVLPELVVPAPFDRDDDGISKSGENYKTVKYEKLTALLIEAIKELSVQNDELRQRLDRLENKD